jgi:hypothetical protein
VKVVMMVHHDVQTPTFEEFFLAEFPRLVSMRRPRRERVALSRLRIDANGEIMIPTADAQLFSTRAEPRP